MKKYTQDNLINSLSLFDNNDVAFLLGAGCSISSGCMSANKMVNEFKRRIYCLKYNIDYSDNLMVNDFGFNSLLEKEFKPIEGNEYSYYFEQCFPNSYDRNKFIKEKFQTIKPSFGYLCFANYIISKKIKRILTTNFDKLCEKAIRRIDENYDVVISSDTIMPLMNSETTIIELHGDYNYDSLKNTDIELNELSNNLVREISQSLPKKIVVIGYSGQDKSVMSFLNEVLSQNQDIELLWCSINEDFCENECVNSLLSFNSNSGYVLINSFDDIFIKYYNSFSEHNSLIDSVCSEISNKSFDLNICYQPENLIFNANEIMPGAKVYCISNTIESSVLKNINDNLSDAFLIQHKGILYGIGDIDKIISALDKKYYEVKELSQINIPINKKCILIKETIKLALKQRGINIFRDNLYIDNSKDIKEGIEIDVDLFGGKICLFTNVNYFVVSDKISNSQKFEINRQKSNLYATKNYSLRETLITQLFPKDYVFEYYITKIIVNQKIIGTKQGCETFLEYNCENEPIMITDTTHRSVNQIKIKERRRGRYN